MRMFRRRLRRFRQKVLKQIDLREQGAQEATAPKVPIVHGGPRVGYDDEKPSTGVGR